MTADTARQGPIGQWLGKHPRVIDVLVIIVSIGPQVASLIYAATAPDAPVGVAAPLPWNAWAVLVLTAVSMWWRRAHPGAVLIAIAAIGVLYPAMNQTAAFAFALFTVASRYSFGRTAGLGGITIAISAASAVGWQFAGVQLIPSSVLDPFALVALAIGMAVRSRRLQREAARALLAEQIEHARATERTRIAAEMHDVVAHSLSVMIALANGAATAWEKHPERSAVALTQLSSVGRNALLDMQRVLHILRDADGELDAVLGASGHNVPDLDQLIEVFRSAGLPVEHSSSPVLSTGDAAFDTTVYRIVQESLTNALRHAAGATRVEVSAELSVPRDEASTELLQLLIVDDGNSVERREPSPGAQKGLVGMRERVSAYGGSMIAGPTDTGGWQVRVTLPVPRVGSTRHD